MAWRDREKLKASLARTLTMMSSTVAMLRADLDALQKDWASLVDSAPLSLDGSDNVDRYEANVEYFKRLLVDLGVIETWMIGIKGDPNPVPSTNPAAYSQERLQKK